MYCALLAVSASCTPGGTTEQCDPAAFSAVRATHASHSEVTVCGTILRVGRLRHSRSGTHRDFELGSNDSAPIEIDANIDVMGDVPLRSGEKAIVRGEYYYDANGRDGVHWTHRSDRGSHPAGYIMLDGVLYR